MNKLSPELQARIRSGVALASVAQCVEELVLNSVDAKATCIAVRVDMSCCKIQVVDNGVGIDRESLEKIADRYMTSKCHTLNDLDERLQHFGYRGEALASIRDIAAVLEIDSRSKQSTQSFTCTFQSGSKRTITESKIHRASAGTTVTIHDLFHSLPVRQKCLNGSLELEKIRQRVEAVALIHPSISFSLRNDANGMKVLQTHKTNSVLGTFTYLYGIGKSRSMCPLSGESETTKINGYIAKESHHNKNLQFMFVNDRLVLKTKLHRLLNFFLSKSSITKRRQSGADEASPNSSGDSIFPKATSERHGIFVLSVTCSPSDYDITFDPRKTLIEFKEWRRVVKLLKNIMRCFLIEHNLILKSEIMFFDDDGDSAVTQELGESLGTDSQEDGTAEQSPGGLLQRYAAGISTSNTANNLTSQTVGRHKAIDHDRIVDEIIASKEVAEKLEGSAMNVEEQTEETGRDAPGSMLKQATETNILTKCMACSNEQGTNSHVTRRAETETASGLSKESSMEIPGPSTDLHYEESVLSADLISDQSLTCSEIGDLSTEDEDDQDAHQITKASIGSKNSLKRVNADAELQRKRKAAHAKIYSSEDPLEPTPSTSCGIFRESRPSRSDVDTNAERRDSGQISVKVISSLQRFKSTVEKLKSKTKSVTTCLPIKDVASHSRSSFGRSENGTVGTPIVLKEGCAHASSKTFHEMLITPRPDPSKASDQQDGSNTKNPVAGMVRPDTALTQKGANLISGLTSLKDIIKAKEDIRTEKPGIITLPENMTVDYSLCQTCRTENDKTDGASLQVGRDSNGKRTVSVEKAREGIESDFAEIRKKIFRGSNSSTSQINPSREEKETEPKISIKSVQDSIKQAISSNHIVSDNVNESVSCSDRSRTVTKRKVSLQPHMTKGSAQPHVRLAHSSDGDQGVRSVFLTSQGARKRRQDSVDLGAKVPLATKLSRLSKDHRQLQHSESGTSSREFLNRQTVSLVDDAPETPRRAHPEQPHGLKPGNRSDQVAKKQLKDGAQGMAAGSTSLRRRVGSVHHEDAQTSSKISLETSEVLCSPSGITNINPDMEPGAMDCVEDDKPSCSHRVSSVSVHMEKEELCCGEHLGSNTKSTNMQGETSVKDVPLNDMGTEKSTCEQTSVMSNAAGSSSAVVLDDSNSASGKQVLGQLCTEQSSGESQTADAPLDVEIEPVTEWGDLCEDHEKKLGTGESVSKMEAETSSEQDRGVQSRGYADAVAKTQPEEIITHREVDSNGSDTHKEYKDLAANETCLESVVTCNKSEGNTKACTVMNTPDRMESTISETSADSKEENGQNVVNMCDGTRNSENIDDGCCISTDAFPSQIPLGSREDDTMSGEMLPSSVRPSESESRSSATASSGPGATVSDSTNRANSPSLPSIIESQESSISEECQMQKASTSYTEGKAKDRPSEAKNTECKPDVPLATTSNKDDSTECGKVLSASGNPKSPEKTVFVGPSWICKIDPNTGKKIFINKITGNSSYVTPSSGEDEQHAAIHVKHRLMPAGSTPLLHADYTPLRPRPAAGRSGHRPANTQDGEKRDSRLSEGLAKHLETQNAQEEEERVVKWRSGSIPESLDSNTKEGVRNMFDKWENPAFQNEPVGPLSVEASTSNKNAVRVQQAIHPYKLTKEIFSDIQVLGQLDNKFIACLVTLKSSGVTSRSHELLTVIDQHAAHERVRLEELTAGAFSSDGSCIKRSTLEQPVKIYLKEEVVRIICAYKKSLDRKGICFRVDDSERNVVYVYELPQCLVEREDAEKRCRRAQISDNSLELMFREQAEILESTNGADATIPAAAFRSAIKFGDPLTTAECEALIKDLATCNLPFQCAHGRPSIMPILDMDHIYQRMQPNERKPIQLGRLLRSGDE